MKIVWINNVTIDYYDTQWQFLQADNLFLKIVSDCGVL